MTVTSGSSERLVGAWVTEATHPLLPGAEILGRATFEWLEGRRFLIQRSHYDHSEIPDAIAVTGVTDGRLSMHYFDSAACTGCTRPASTHTSGVSGATSPRSASASPAR